MTRCDVGACSCNGPSVPEDTSIQAAGACPQLHPHRRQLQVRKISPALRLHAVKRSTVCHAKCRARYTHPRHHNKVAPMFPCLSSAGCCAAECLLIGMLGCCYCGCALYRCQLCYPGCYCLCCTTVVSRHALLWLLLTHLDSHLVMHSAELPVILHS